MQQKQNMEVSRCCFAAVMQQKQQLHVSRCCFAAVCVEKLRLEISSYKDADQLEGTVIDKGVCHLRNNDF
ncbi:hypothetical protein CISIN_1g037082mg [Citrus sinensis]|uniref:Uncharacterized protein n=1 Tax=Citrus sinensis TaxID=2711 RepID=A0A067DD02_CITSI|nr:hypothetical protein CISIN_1g037082mg [Citrus sinensis]